MDDQERHREGAKARRKVLGNAWVDRADADRNAFNAEFQDFITRCAWGEIWTRSHFDERVRRILVIGTMMAIGRWEEFRMHVRAALIEGGLSSDDIKEIILQQAIYCGVPVGNHAFREAGAVLKELGKEPQRQVPPAAPA
jgi:4-carboxymuconolactone decarboxylase